MVSENTSSNKVTFYGSSGYINYIDVLKDIAKNYETNGITSGSRYINYMVGDDSKTYDTDLIESVFGTMNDINNHGYWIANCHEYRYEASGYTFYYVNFVSGNSINSFEIAQIAIDGYGEVHNEEQNYIRPIVILKSGITSINGNGSKESPWKVN